jgi:hypothetical protein
VLRAECQCPKIDLAEWRDREVTLLGHRFLTTRTPLFFHLPYRLCRDLEALCTRAENGPYRPAGAPLVLHRDGWIAGEVLISVETPAESAPGLVTFQNLFYSRVAKEPGFDAALREMPRFYRDLRAAQVGPLEAMYYWYLSCPRCLLERGPGQIILLARSRRVLASRPCPLEASTAGPTPQVLPCAGMTALR